MKALTAAALAAVAWLSAALGSPAAARPYTIDDLLAQASFGDTAIDPSGRWLVFEQRDRYDRLPHYDVGYSPSAAFAWLAIVDLRRPGPAHPLLPRDPASGQLIGAFSPSGRRLVVYRLRGLVWDFGVVELATRSVRWFDLAVEDAGRGRTLQWRGDDELVAIVRPDRRPPTIFRSGPQVAERLPAWWAAAARGESAHTVVGSGAYVGVRSRDPARRLVRVDVATGAVTSLAEGAFFDLELSPDRGRVALLASGTDIQPRGDSPVRGTAGLETEASRLSVLDLSSGAQVSACAACDVLPQLLAWSPDGRGLLAFVRRDGPWTAGRLMRVAAASGAVEDVQGDVTPDLDLNPVAVRAGWMGGDPVLFGRRAGESRSDWHRLGPRGPVNLTAAMPPPDRWIRAAGARGLIVLAGGQMWRTDRLGIAHRLGAATARPALPDLRGSAGARLANVFPLGSWLTLQSAGQTRLAWVTTRSVARMAALPPDLGRLLGASGETASVVGSLTDDRGVEALKVFRPGRAPVVVATINATLAETEPMRIEPVHHTGQHGEPLLSWLILPQLPPGAPPPPLIVRPYLGYVYPNGPRVLGMEDGFFGNLRMLTGHGYAVLMPSLPTPAGGMTEPAVGVGERILAVERAAREDPRLAGLFDPEREALLGWSFGGYTVMATITQTDHFRAAVALDGISDLTAYWSHITLERAVAPESGYGSNWSTGTVESTQPQMGAPPWADPQRYQRNSPLLQADRIHTPLLLIHGWRDQIPYAGSEAMFSALFRQGKDAQLVTYWAAEHRTVSPGDVRDAWARTFAFLDEHLQGP